MTNQREKMEKEERGKKKKKLRKQVNFNYILWEKMRLQPNKEQKYVCESDNTIPMGLHEVNICINMYMYVIRRWANSYVPSNVHAFVYVLWMLWCIYVCFAILLLFSLKLHSKERESDIGTPNK